MVKQAETLVDLTELREKLSRTANEYISKKMCLSPPKLVQYVRSYAFNHEVFPGKTSIEEEEIMVEIADALDVEGFIRHDLFPNTYNAWLLYSAIQPGNTLKGLTMNIKAYETTPVVTDEQMSEIKKALEFIDAGEQRLITTHYGLNGERTLEYDELAKEFKTTEKLIRETERKIFRELRQPRRLCRMPMLFGWRNNKYPDLELYRINDGRDGIDCPVQADLDAKIEILTWTYGTYECLKKERINTIGSIIRMPKLNWSNMKEGLKDEIRENMKIAGYLLDR